MAKRKKAKKVSRRRRSVGAVALNPSSPLVQYGSIALGFLLGTKIDTMVSKVIPANVDAKIVAAAEAGLGAMLSFSKGKKSLLKTAGGGILLGAGIKKGLTAFGIGTIGGYQSVNVVNGYGQVPAVGGAGVKRIGGYMPGATGLNGYPTARQSVGSIEANATIDNDMI